MPVCHYLDLTTAHVTEREWEAIAANWPALDDSGPRVIKHDYGAWVNVRDFDEDGDQHDEAILREHYPNFMRCHDRARELDCAWINFDQDAPHEPDLPIHEW
jgi:hypothetical protein